MGPESGPTGCQGSGRGPGLEIQQPVVWARASVQPVYRVSTLARELEPPSGEWKQNFIPLG